MDQKKTGSFLKELRKEKKITQEQLAELFNVSGKTVSRWETGRNMPDLDLLIRLIACKQDDDITCMAIADPPLVTVDDPRVAFAPGGGF